MSKSIKENYIVHRAKLAGYVVVDVGITLELLILKDLGGDTHQFSSDGRNHLSYARN